MNFPDSAAWRQSNGAEFGGGLRFGGAISADSHRGPDPDWQGNALFRADVGDDFRTFKTAPPCN